MIQKQIELLAQSPDQPFFKTLGALLSDLGPYSSVLVSSYRAAFVF
jgi:hypothetical protein